MTQSYVDHQPSQAARVGATGLAQAPLTRLRALRIPGSSPETTARAVQTSQPSDPPSAAGRTFVRVPAFTIPSSRVNTDGYAVLQQWEGTVSDLSGENVTAVLRDWTNPALPDEEVTVSLDEFSPEDQSLVTGGTVFYWSIGYRTRSGTRERVSSFQLRRMPPPSKAERARAEKEASVLSRLLSSRHTT